MTSYAPKAWVPQSAPPLVERSLFTSSTGHSGLPINPRQESFLKESDQLATPFLLIDLQVIEERYRALAAALPESRLFYAVKANPAPEVVRCLSRLGAGFDVASCAEVDLCLACGVAPQDISYGSTIRKLRDLTYAYDAGVRIYTFDCVEELTRLVRYAPSSLLYCRVGCETSGADWPLTDKFGCDLGLARQLVVQAARSGMRVGVSFHVGSQQRNPCAWQQVLGIAARLRQELESAGHSLAAVNLGGGFPGSYVRAAPPLREYAHAIQAALQSSFGHTLPAIVAEPGRYLVADAGVLRSEVVLVSRRSASARRWVYIDIGVFGGLAETLGESVRYRIRTPRDGDALEPMTIAGPTCDSADILYREYWLPGSLCTGDRIDLLATGAYTSSYASVGFNGFAPPPSYLI